MNDCDEDWKSECLRIGILYESKEASELFPAFCFIFLPATQEIYDVLVSEILGYSALVRSGHLGKHPEVLKDTVVRLLAMKEGGEAIGIMRTTLVMDILERVS